MVFTAVITALIALALKATMGWRITSEEEDQGVDTAEHRESGYDLAGPEIRRGNLVATGAEAPALGSMTAKAGLPQDTDLRTDTDNKE